MNITIKKIAIFNNTGEKRFIEFDTGLNIITGDSKTGKSALIEIIDYCLFSSRSSIPVGKITDFAKLFVVIFQVDNIFIVVGRPALNDGRSNQAFLNIETNYDKLTDLDSDYFNKLSLKPIKNNVQTEFEEYLGLSLKKLDSEEDKFGKLSIRDAVSFLFQHQNLIANKHAIFYRFDDIVKRKRVIQALPVLLGIANADYFKFIKDKKEIERKIIAEEKILEKIRLKSETQLVNLRELIQIYYSMLDISLEDDLSLLQLNKIGLNLPSPPQILADQSKYYTKLIRFENERELLSLDKAEVEKAISSLLNNSDDSFDYARTLFETQIRQKNNEEIKQELSCPICNNPVEEINQNIKKLEDSKAKLVDELTKLNSFSQDSTQILERFREKQKELSNQIKILSLNINQISSQNSVVGEEKKKREEIIYKKGVIETTIKNLLEQVNLSNYNSELVELKEQLEIINSKLSKYVELKSFKKTTELFLKIQMDRIANKLDFENELRPIDFHFDIDSFSFYHMHNKTKIRLDEMGSGANWLACHISIFLSFLHLSCSNKKSVIPSFLIIDQPSQVYFPRTAKKDELNTEEKNEFDNNIDEVRNIFKVLNEEIELIFEKTGRKPQIIVLEHSNDDAFKKHIIRDWNKNKDEGLI